MLYKFYDIQPFVQPKLTCNGTMGGAFFAVTQSHYFVEGGNTVENWNDSPSADTNQSNRRAWQAFDSGDYLTRWQVNNVALDGNYQIRCYNPMPLKIESITISNANNTYAVKKYALLGSNDYNNWQEITSGENETAESDPDNKQAPISWTITLPKDVGYYKYYALQCSPRTTTAMMIDNISIKGSCLNIKQIRKIHAGSLIKDVYYKYQYRPFVQPVMTENGTMGGDSFAVASDSYLAQAGLPAYGAFDGTENGWHSANGHPHWLAFYNPNPLKLSKLWIRNRGGGSAGGAFIKDWQLQYSDNGSDWAVITSGTSTNTDNAYWSIQTPEGYNQYHRYYRLYVTSGAGYNSSYTVIVEMAVEAEERGAVKSDSSDYDYCLRENDGRINTIYRGTQRIWYDKNLYRDVMVNPNMTSATAPSGQIIANVNRYASGGVIQCWGNDNQKEGDYGTRDSSTQYIFPENARLTADGYYYVSCEILSQTNIEMQNVYARIYYLDDTYEQFAIAAVTPRDNNFHSYATPLFKITSKPIKSLMIGWHGVMYNSSYYCYQYMRNCRLMKRIYRFEE